jgi:hypothetical protein
VLKAGWLLVTLLMVSNCQSRDDMASISLKNEVSLADLLGPGRYEASGVTVFNGLYYVALDNDAKVVEVAPNLKTAVLLGDSLGDVGFEGITVLGQSFLVVEESLPSNGSYQARLSQQSPQFIEQHRTWLPVELTSGNKGIEGLTTFEFQQKQYVLALCEGNLCASGKKGKKVGGGRIHVFEKSEAWSLVATIKLPKSLAFIDYSGIDIRADGQLIVVSQASAAVWVGKLLPGTWIVEGEGQTLPFPLSKKGKIRYCNIEGVAWLDEQHFVAVSDAKKGKQKKRCKKKEQSIHVFKIH